MAAHCAAYGTAYFWMSSHCNSNDYTKAKENSSHSN